MDQRINPLNANTTGGGQAQRNADAMRQRSAQSSSQSGQAGKTIGARSDYAITRSPSALRAGDTIRGEITDLRNNEIAITLEDNTTIRAFISDSSSFSIGQTGTFRLSQIAGNALYLENVSLGLSNTEAAMINKALEEAGLPPTDYNQNAVKALMDNMLPINRASIQHLMQQAYDFETEDMNTLAVMNRLMMKMDKESVTQFSNYRNDNYQLLEQLGNFSKDIPALLHALADNSPADAVAAFGKSMLSIGLTSPMDLLSNNNTSTPTLANLPPEVSKELVAMLENTPLTEDTLAQLEDRTLPLQDAVTLLRDAATNGTIQIPKGTSPAVFAEQINHLIEVLEPSAQNTPEITEDYVRNIITLQNEKASELAAEGGETPEAAEEGRQAQTPLAAETETAQNTQEKQESPLTAAGKFFQTLSDSAKNTLSASFQSLRAPKEVQPDPTAAQPNKALEMLTETYENFSREHDLLSNYLSADERNELLNHLQEMPISKNMLLKISSGEATTKEVMEVIHNTMSMTDSEQVKSLLQSEGFEKLFARMLQSNWTLTPEQLQKDKISDFYNQMQRQLGEFRNLIQSTLSGSDSENLSGFAKNMEDNISFMKTLNETFSYFQLPLKLPSQDAHGDLYVYTQKEKLKNHPEKNSVLLHLDMEHLGKIDIRIDRNRYDVLTNFSLNDEESVNLFRVNADMLKNALANEGYNCQVQVSKKEAPSPTMDDFINTKVNTHATTDMKRFSFDIRA